MADPTIAYLLGRVDEMLTRQDLILLGQVLIATQEYRTDVADADPGPGRFRLNNINLANATEGYFDLLDTAGASIASIMETYDDSSSAMKGTLILRSTTNAAHWAAYKITGMITDATGYKKIPLVYLKHEGIWAQDERFAQAFYRTGDVGQPNTLTVGTVSVGDAAVEITGTAPNQTVNFTLPQGLPGTDGTDGVDGNRFLYGLIPPAPDVGDNDDFYIDVNTWTAYGPKLFSGWPGGVPMIGPQGIQGIQGIKGEDGRSIFFGTGAPGLGLGNTGDGYIDTTTMNFYGPKADTPSWGDPISMKGLQGIQGIQGEPGPQGEPGAPGSGSGDVVGPVVSVNGRISVFNGTTGQILADSGYTIADIMTAIATATSSISVNITALTARVSKIDSASPSLEMLWRFRHGY